MSFTLSSAVLVVPLKYGVVAWSEMLSFASSSFRSDLKSEPTSVQMTYGEPVAKMWLTMWAFATCTVRFLEG